VAQGLRSDHAGITVADLDAATTFVVGLGRELSRFVRPGAVPGSPAAMADELGLRNVAFEVDDLRAAVDRLAADGHGLVGGTLTQRIG